MNSSFTLMLLAGQEGETVFLPPLEPEAAPGGASSRGAPARMAAGRRPAAASPSVAASPTGLPGESLAAIAAPPAEAAEALEALQGALASTVEAAFFDALADGLRRGETARLAALLVDARDQLGALLPQSQAAAVGQQQGGGGSSGEGQVLLAELQEKLDADYVSQRLQTFDAHYCAQAFDLLVHSIARLQAPARRAGTQAAYAQVAALFAAAAAAPEAAPVGQAGEAAPAAPAAPATPPEAEPVAAQQPSEDGERVLLRLSCSGEDVAVQLAPPAQVAEEGGPVQLRLTCSGEGVAVQLAPPPLVEPAAPAAAAPAPEGGGLSWELRLVPSSRGDGSVVAVMAPGGTPVLPSASQQSPTAGGGTSAPTGGGGGNGTPTGGGGGAAAIGEASVAAVVAAARFMHKQLGELRSDVAAAHLALLKEAILGSGSGVEYERQRYQRALHAAAGTHPGTSCEAAGGGAGAPAAPDLVATALPRTHAWLRQVLVEAPPLPPANPQHLDVPYSRACVSAGLLLLLQRPHAVSAADCPETLLLDLGAIVALQNELQRLCLLAASLLIVQQILASQRALPPAPEAAAMRQRLVRRMGVLLASGRPLEALVLELHQAVQVALAAARGGSGPGAEEGTEQGRQQQAQQQQQQQPAEVGVEVVRRMAEGIFSTEHTAYKRVQAGIAAAATALFRSAGGGAGGSPSGGGGGASATAAHWRLTLRGIGADALAPEVHRFAQAVDRLAAVSASVAHPVVYAPLLQQLLQDHSPLLQRRRH